MCPGCNVSKLISGLHAAQHVKLDVGGRGIIPTSQVVVVVVVVVLLSIM